MTAAAWTLVSGVGLLLPVPAMIAVLLVISPPVRHPTWAHGAAADGDVRATLPLHGDDREE